MKGFFKKLYAMRPTKRKLMQLYFALLFNSNIKGFVTGTIYKGTTKQMCVPGLNCYSCPGAVGACPLGSLQGSFSADRSTLFYVGGILLIYCILFGRMICGWLCPFGFIQDLLAKIKTPKLKKGPVTRVLSYFKYVILVLFVFIIPIMYAFRDTPLPAFCKYICPAGTIEGGVSLLSNRLNDSYFSMLGPLFTWKFMLMVSILVGCIFIFRMFCRFFCPLGALYGLFNKISFFGIRTEQEKCTDCGLCVSNCKFDIRHAGDRECISCGECVDICPTKAIVWKGSSIFIHKNEIPEQKAQKQSRAKTVTRIISAVLAVAVLISAFVYFRNDSTKNLAELYGAELNVITPDGITEEIINPAESGKITIVNFWGTWCTPCVQELPYFNQIAAEYGDEIEVIAVHTNMVSDTAPDYIGKYYADSKITFACDLPDEGYYTMLGGRGTYPYTVVLNENGIVSKTFVEALEYEDLKKAVEETAGN